MTSFRKNLRNMVKVGVACLAVVVVTSCKEDVKVTSVALNEGTLTLSVGTTATLIATVQPTDATDKTVTWTSSNSAVATVANGTVTAKAEGSATITATTNDGKKTATCIVEVVQIIAQGNCGAQGDNLTWVLTKDYKLIISGNGAMANYTYPYDNRLPWDSYRGMIKIVVIGNSVTSIGNGTFSRCESLTSLTIGNSVTSIGTYAFAYCYSLTAVTIPDSVTNIRGGAFNACGSLTSLIIGSSVTSIEGSAFNNCGGLSSVTCKAIIPPVLGSSVFQETDRGIPIHVPRGSLTAYQDSDWRYFFWNFIED